MSSVKILTLNDLFNYFSKQNVSMKFSSSEDGSSIVVGIPASVKFGKSEEDYKGLIPVVLMACHTNENLNGSNISKKSMKDALSTFANRPILAYIHEVDGEDEFGWHAMHVEDEGLVYDEIPVGVIPESNNGKLTFNENEDRYDVEINGYLFEEYNKASDILKRLGESPVSVELNIQELSFDAKKNVLNIEKFYFEGVTILGKNDDGDEVHPGMKGANIKLADFSKENTVFNHSDELVEQLKRLNDNLKAFNIDTTERKEDGTVKFDELLKQYNVTIEDVTFEYADMSDEELEKKFEEMFGEHSEDEGDPSSEFEEDNEPNEDPDNFESDEDNQDDDDQNENSGESDDNDNFEEDNSEDGSDEGDDPQEEDTDFSAVYAVTRKGVEKKFEISMTQIISALSDLVNATYGETDDTWYSVDVYEDSKTVVMIDYWRGKAYKQSYKARSGQYSLVGDRVEVFSQWLTADEITELDNMRANYSSISDKLQKYEEAEADVNKMNILNSEDYSAIAESEEFKQLINDRADFSVEDVQKKCDEMLLKFVKENKNFSVNTDTKKKGIVRMPEFKSKKGKGRYGNLFSKKNK